MPDLFRQIFTSKKFYAAIGILILCGALFLFALDQWIMPDYTNYDEGLTVPDATHLSLSEAEDLLTSYGLRYEVADRRSNSAFPPDYVIDQSPSPAEIVKPERKIYLTVNAVSAPKVEVPNVVNLSFRNARIQLENYGLNVGVVSYESSRFKKSVLRQSVPAGKSVDKGTSVNLAVSDGLGEKMVDVPGIVGLKLTEAQQMIRKAGLRVGEIRFQPSKNVTPNTIIDYLPKKNKVIEGETLKLIVSERYDVKEENESGAVSVDTTYMSDPDSN